MIEQVYLLDNKKQALVAWINVRKPTIWARLEEAPIQISRLRHHILDGMPQAIGAQELKTLVDEGAQLVEVLPPREYEEEHLPGAINLPLKSFTTDNLSRLDRRRPVIVYCWDDD